MIVECQHCSKHYDDARRWTICPHKPLDEDPSPTPEAQARMDSAGVCKDEGCACHQPPAPMDAAKWDSLSQSEQTTYAFNLKRTLEEVYTWLNDGPLDDSHRRYFHRNIGVVLDKPPVEYHE